MRRPGRRSAGRPGILLAHDQFYPGGSEEGALVLTCEPAGVVLADAGVVVVPGLAGCVTTMRICNAAALQDDATADDTNL